jgi:methyl-accepting chemotaxis protein
MKKASLQLKSLTLIAVALLVSAAASVAGIYRLHGALDEMERTIRGDLHAQQLVHKASATLRLQVQEWKNVLLRGWQNADLEKYWNSFLKQEVEVRALAGQAREATQDPAVLAGIEKFLVAHDEAGKRYREAVEVFKVQGRDPHAGDRGVQGVDRAAAKILDEVETAIEKHAEADLAAARARADRIYRFALAAILITALVTLAAVYLFMRRAVLNPIAAGVKAAERIAAGDLTVRIEARSRDEAGKLLDSLSRMSGSLTTVVSQVRESAESVVAAASQVATGTTDLSQRTEEQASSLEETAASMEELSGTVRQTADNARQADELARNAYRRAEQGGAEVVAAVGTMEEMTASAKRIGDIISVIDGIAFQTNILALNAAVEAARAGEQGRGFAVVASEVRSLAQRSAQAAKEIKDLIGGSVQRVENGARLVTQAGETMHALVADVKRVSELMGSIAEAAAEQSRGVQQVNKTVTEMDKVVQQNAAAVQQSASAAESMRRQAQSLVEAVSTFRIAGGTQRPAARVTAPAREKPAVPREAALAVARTPEPPAARSQRALAVAGDDWEEF